ncbi:MAG TPA: hypothetical protein VGH40_07155 [Roseiarcus sp.]|jgi:hypothetical protein
MRVFSIFAAGAVMLSTIVLASSAADAGCYRLGLSGYHWYHHCAGPSFIYPHQRVCHNGHCWYR